MSLLKTTLPDGTVRDATVEEEDAFMVTIGKTHTLSLAIMKQRLAVATPARTPRAEPSRARNRTGKK